jgi:hypothetical protein
MQQLTMTGDDWKSGREQAQEARAVARREQTGRAAAKALDAAAQALTAYLQACRDCGDGSGDERHGVADCRHRLITDTSEYAAYLQAKHGPRAGLE